ncbi:MULTISPECIES: hypothetical protein [Pseudoxanthomonas]|nr:MULTISPECIES: hypothetical protein [Pseudoxanthomonas]
MTVRKASRLFAATEEELAEEAVKYAKSNRQEGMSFPLWYTNCLKLGAKDICEGKSTAEAFQRVTNFPDALKEKAHGLIRSFQEIVAANDDIDFTPKQSPKGCNTSIEGVTLSTRQDLVASNKSDGRLLLLYFHVVDAPMKTQQAVALLHLAQYIADARQINADVAIVDIPRKRLIRVHEDYDPEQMKATVANAMSKLQ